MPERAYGEEERAVLLGVARRSLGHGLAHGAPLPVPAERFGPTLREPRASFVTLKCEGVLRGCMGRLAPEEALICDVSRNAYRAGFHDPRFAPLEARELAGLSIHVSVLGSAEPLACRDEAELLARLRPGVDGLILRAGPHLATFLPAVWQSLPDPALFVSELARKAGLSNDVLFEDLCFERYEVVEFGTS